MANTVIIFGPAGCGKTRNAKALQRFYGCNAIVDEWEDGDPVSPGALHLTIQQPTGRHRAIVASFATAIAAATGEI